MTVRAGRGASLVELVRLLLAAELVGTPAKVSLDPTVAAALGLIDCPIGRVGTGRGAAPARASSTAVESTAEFVARVRSGAVTGRVRVLGDDGVACAARSWRGRTSPWWPDLCSATGRRELLSVLREQAVSRTRHRFGHLQRPPGA